MNIDVENIKQAKQSFNSILDNKKYSGIIKDDNQLALLLDLVNTGKYNTILDIGTGTGYLAFPLAEQFPTASVCGIDIAEIIVEKNNIVVKEKGIHNLSFQVFDGLKYPFSDECIDLIVTRYAFHHFPDVENAIQQMNRILVKGGKVLISDPMRNEKDDNGIIDNFMRVKKDGHIRFYSREGKVRMCKQACIIRARPRGSNTPPLWGELAKVKLGHAPLLCSGVFDSSNELDELFVNNGFTKEKQMITNMRFPFAKQVEYINLYDQITDKEKLLYDITNDSGVIWIKHINVGNTIFVKQ